ncbi:LuxR C-terminal-related transcriptional regulator [Janibacter melonis]|uniref:LuxR C-terminal-related transcriptional regulator n=1 Tax=Janibacter melonis TaxID=262209 RepID=UPI002095AD6D|nr:LuxR C-terminal-related transcriptional regulator [Janibacter melonis]
MWADEPLIGRDEDMLRVAETLSGRGCCTVVGPGGVGKSALARAVVRATSLLPGRERAVVWVDAEPVADVDVLLDQVLLSAGAERLPGQSPAEAVRLVLGRSTALVVLDGVEHLGADLDTVVATWPTSPDGLHLLATSRRSPGESMRPVVHLDPLPTTGPGASSPAARLLLGEVSARGGDAGELAADETRLDAVLAATGGLPVAVQLTADHVARFGLRHAAARPAPVDEVVYRCVERTLDLLEPHEVRVFEGLGVTRGSFTLEVVRACGARDLEDAQAVAARLLDHGLLATVDDRLELLPPVHDGAAQLLERRGETLGTVRRAVDHILIGRSGSPTEALAADLDTYVHLADVALGTPDLVPCGVELAHHLFEPMHDRMRQRELLALLERVLLAVDTATAPVAAAVVSETARRASLVAAECDTIAHARRWLGRARSLAKDADDPLLEARCWVADAWLALDLGDHARAAASARRAALASDDLDVVLPALRCRAETALSCGDLDETEELCAEVLRRCDGPTSADGLLARTTTGWCLVERGRLAEAVSHARRLAADLPDLAGGTSEIDVEAELIAVAADPGTSTTRPSLEDAPGFTWWMRLEQRVRLAARLPAADCWEQVMRTAADVVVLADLVPLAHPRLGAMLLLGDAALAGGEHRQAARAYELALRDAARGPSRLRGADALDGVAVLASQTGRHELAGSAAATAAHIRGLAGAEPWPRPSLPDEVPAPGRVPSGWVRAGAPTSRAADDVARALRAAVPADPLAELTRAERQVAELVRRGMTNQEIADDLVVSRRTVESHLSRIFRKLDLRSRTQLATIGRPGQGGRAGSV